MSNLVGFQSASIVSRAMSVVFLSFTLISSSALAATDEVEPNNEPTTAQNLNGRFGLESDADVGDKTTNTSTTLPHQTVLGVGQGPVSKDIYQFTVGEAGTGVFDIDYGEFNFSPDRFGIATQLDGTIWIKDEKTFYFLDDQLRPQWGFEADYPGTIHNTLAVHPVTGLFYSINRGSTNLVSIDPVSGAAQNIGKTNVADVTALAFNGQGRLFAVTGSDENNSSLFELNPDSGALIAFIGATETSGIKGIDFNPQTGELFGFAAEAYNDLRNSLAANSAGELFSIGSVYQNNSQVAVLYRLNPSSGESELVGSTGLPEISAIAFDSSDQLYATSGAERRPSTLYRLDPNTGAVIDTIGDTGLFGIVGIDFQPGTEKLFAFSNGADTIYLAPSLTAASDGTVFAIQNNRSPFLISVDTASPWQVSYRGLLPFKGDSPSLAMSPDNRLFATTSNLTDYTQGDELYELNPADGSILQKIGTTDYRAIQGLAFDPVSGDLYAHANAYTDFDLSDSLASDINGMFYSFGYDEDGPALLQIDPVGYVTTSLGSVSTGDISALAFDSTDRLFGVDSFDSGTSTLYELDPSNGSIIQTVGATGEPGITGLDFHPDTGTLYAYANGRETYPNNTFAIDSGGTAFFVDKDTDELLSADLSTGLVTLVGSLPKNDFVALAFDASDQLFASTGSDSEPSKLYQLDPVDASLIGDIGAIGFGGVTGLAFHPTTQVLYGHSQSPNELISIDTVTGAGSLIGSSLVSGNIADLDFDKGTDILYGVTGSSRRIYSFNLATGEASQLSTFSGNSHRVGMAFDGSTLYIKGGSNVYSVVPASGTTTDVHALTFAGHLYTLDKLTGAATLITETISPGEITDMSFNPDTWTLNGWLDDTYGISEDHLVSIDINSGTISMVGSSPLTPNGRGLAFSRATGNLSLTENDHIFDVNPNTGLITPAGNLVSQFPTLLILDIVTAAATPIGPTITESQNTYQWGRFSDLAFDTDNTGGNPDYGKLYGAYELDGDVYTFNTVTGQATKLGENSLGSGERGLVKAGSDLLIMRPSNSFYSVNQTDGLTSFNFNASNPPSDYDALSTIDTNTAQPTMIGQTGVGHMADLTFDDGGTLFGWSSGAELYSINTTTGLANNVGDSGQDTSQVGLAFDDVSGNLYMKSERDQFTVSRIDGSANYISTYQSPPPRLMTIDLLTAATTDIGASAPGGRIIPDITFTADGRLYGYENDEIDSLVQFDIATGQTTALWFFETSDAGLAFTSDGTLWLKDDEDGMYTLDRTNGQATFFSATIDFNQDNVLAVNSNDEFFTYDNSDGGLFKFDPVDGSFVHLGDTLEELSALAFDATGRLFAMEGDSSSAPSILYEIDPADGSEIAMIGDTGFTGIEAMDFHPVSGMLYAHSSTDGMVLEIDPSTAATAEIGQSGALVIDDFAFSPDAQLYGWFADDDDDNADERQTLVSIDLVTGAATPLHRFGEFSSKLTLLASDGTTVLATNSSADFRWGQLGSNPGGSSNSIRGAVAPILAAGNDQASQTLLGGIPNPGASGPDSSDAYIEYNFITPGIYYIQVESDGSPYVPFGATYSLNVSVPGGFTPMIFTDSFEGGL